MTSAIVDAEPEPIRVDFGRAALVIIDMQRDFLEPGGFGESLGNDVSLLAAAIGPCQALLGAARETGMMVVHTREGHLPDLSDAPRAKVERGAPSLRIGAPGPMGRILSTSRTSRACTSSRSRPGCAICSRPVPSGRRCARRTCRASHSDSGSTRHRRALLRLWHPLNRASSWRV